MTPRKTGNGTSVRAWIGLVAGPLLLALMLLFPPPDGMTVQAWRTAAVAALMAVWWMSEAVPIAATALLPIVLFPLLRIATVSATTAPYANEVIYLFLGGFLIAMAIESCGLHKRMALALLFLAPISSAFQAPQPLVQKSQPAIETQKGQTAIQKNLDDALVWISSQKADIPKETLTMDRKTIVASLPNIQTSYKKKGFAEDEISNAVTYAWMEFRLGPKSLPNSEVIDVNYFCRLATIILAGPQCGRGCDSPAAD